jgi:hypothetical protein
MPLIVVSEGTPLMKPGTYPATLISISPKRLVTQYSKNGEEQDFLEWTWLVEGPDPDVEINSLTTPATGPKSRIAEYLAALLGGEPAVGDGFDEKDLVGKRVLVSTIVDGKGWSKIDKMVAAPTARAATAAPAKTAPPVKEPKVAPVEDVPDPEPAVEEVSEDDLPF